jgi:hypothetical protein
LKVEDASKVRSVYWGCGVFQWTLHYAFGCDECPKHVALCIVSVVCSS